MNPARLAPVRRSEAEARRPGSSTRLLQLQGDEQADHYSEQSRAFYKCRHDEHSSLNFTRSFRLTTDGVHRAATDAANAQASANDGQTSTNAGTHYGETNRINNLQ